MIRTEAPVAVSAAVRMPRIMKVIVTILLVGLTLVAGYGSFVGCLVTRTLSPAQISLFRDHAYTAPAPKPYSFWPLRVSSDDLEHPAASQATLFENGVRIGPPHAPHDRIAGVGGGAYSHWGSWIYFSASDNSDARRSGRSYVLLVPAVLPLGWLTATALMTAMALYLLWGKARVRWAGNQRSVDWNVISGAVRRFAGWTGFALIASIGCAYNSALVIGGVYWLILTAILVFGVIALRNALVAAAHFVGYSWQWRFLDNLAVMAASLGICFAAMEFYLGMQEAATMAAMSGSAQSKTDAATWHSEATAVDRPAMSGSEQSKTDIGDRVIQTGRAKIVLPRQIVAKMTERQQFVTMPDEWKMTYATIPGTTMAFHWHGVLHIHDEHGFRRQNGAFPAKDPHVFRVMVVGDSLTYGDGIEPEWTYPAQLQRLLSEKYDIEFINLGVDGFQSEDVAREIGAMAPIVKPDLILYGVCLNDFLPSGVGQYQKDIGVPLPKWLKSMSEQRTRLAGLLDDGYRALLMRIGVSLDFYDDILKDFKGYKERFGNDVAQMNAFALSRDLPPVVGLVLDQFVNYGGRGYKIAQTAEELMTKAGFDVIPTEGYYKKYDGSSFTVSHWEGHPNEEADAIFATMIADHLMAQPYLAKYAKHAPVAFSTPIPPQTKTLAPGAAE